MDRRNVLVLRRKVAIRDVKRFQRHEFWFGLHVHDDIISFVMRSAPDSSRLLWYEIRVKRVDECECAGMPDYIALIRFCWSVFVRRSHVPNVNTLTFHGYFIHFCFIFTLDFIACWKCADESCLKSAFHLIFFWPKGERATSPCFPYISDGN